MVVIVFKLKMTINSNYICLPQITESSFLSLYFRGIFLKLILHKTV